MQKPFVKYILSQKMKYATGIEDWYDILHDTRKDYVKNYAKELKKKDPNIILGMREVVEIEIDIDD